MKNPFVIGQRIYLRAIEREDAPVILPWINDPEVRQFVRAYRPLNLAGEEAFIDKMRTDDTAIGFMIVLKDGDRPIGITALHNLDLRNRKAEFGITIGEKSCWSQGYGGDATHMIVDYGFATLNLNRVSLFVYDYNARAIRCYEKVGFQKEGLLRQEYYHNGRYWDTIAMSILRTEWDRLKSERGQSPPSQTDAPVIR